MTRKGDVMTNTINVTSPADLVGLIPQMLGFYVGDSVVLVGIADRHLGGVIRFDHDDVVPLAPETLAEPLARLVEHGATHALVVSYGHDTAEELAPLVAAVSAAGIAVLDVGRVEGAEWVSQNGQRTPVPGFTEDLPVPAYSRDALAASMVPMGDAATEAALDAAEPPTGEQVPTAVEAWAALLTGRVQPEAHVLATALPLLTDIGHRDTLIAVLTRDSKIDLASLLTTEHAHLMRETMPQVTQPVLTALLEICRATPPKHAPDVLAVAAVCHMSAGMATHSGLLAQQALNIDPGHRLAGLIKTAAEHGLDLTAA